MSNLHALPQFKNEAEEATFWSTHDTTDYFDSTKSLINPRLPNLKPSTKTITIRVTQSLLEDLKMLAHKKDVPYQSLVKMFLTSKVEDEQRSL